MSYFIKSINWIFTYKCNLKCSHCDIWSNDYKNELDLEEIEKIVSSKLIQDSYKQFWEYFDIALSWWEPLLIENLEEKMLLIDKYLPGSIHSISTNWVLINKLLRLLIFWKKHWKTFRKINISIDWKELNHDKQRWTKWSFYKTIETIKKVKKIFPEQIIELKMTITKLNYKDIIFLWKLADKLWVFFSFKPVENMTNYTNQSNDLWKNKPLRPADTSPCQGRNWDIMNSTFKKYFSGEEIEVIEKQIFDNDYIIKQNNYINKSFFYKIPEYLRCWLWEEKKNCSIAKDSITIMPDGKVFACILMNKIWNLNNKSLDDIWNSQEIIDQRKQIENGECPECMLMCGSFKSKNLYE